MKTITRHGDTMIAIETASAIIDFADILDATKVVCDGDESMSPWEDCDGFEHEAIPFHRLPDEADPQAMRGYIRHERCVLTLPEGEDYGIYKAMREQGASRQVAAEAVAADRRQTLGMLAGWYRDGWQWYGVRCTFNAIDDNYSESVWGIDDADYAEHEVKPKIALEVAAQLEQAGYTVTGRPEPEKRLGAKRQGTTVSREGVRNYVYTQQLTPTEWQAEWKRNLSAQNWRG